MFRVSQTNFISKILKGTRIQSQFLFLIEKSIVYAKITIERAPWLQTFATTIDQSVIPGRKAAGSMEDRPYCSYS